LSDSFTASDYLFSYSERSPISQWRSCRTTPNYRTIAIQVGLAKRYELCYYSTRRTSVLICVLERFSGNLEKDNQASVVPYPYRRLIALSLILFCATFSMTPASEAVEQLHPRRTVRALCGRAFSPI
jgi:hypothetical protein